jgi:hypothetical protein
MRRWPAFALLAGFASCALACGARTDIDDLGGASTEGGVAHVDAGQVPDDGPTPDAGLPCAVPAGVVELVALPETTRITYAIALNDESVYWLRPGGSDTGGDLVMAVPKCGGAAVTLATGQAYVNEIAVDEQNVYWTNASSEATGTVMSVGIHGGALVTLASGGNPGGIAVDATYVYYTDRWGDAVMRVAKAGGAPVTLAPRQTSPDALAINATHVCWTNDGDEDDDQGPLTPAGVVCMSKGGGAPVTVASGAAIYWLIAMDDGTVYSTPGDGSGAASIIAVSTSGGATVTLASGFPAGLAVDATEVYWTDSPEQSGMGTVMAVPKTGGRPVGLAHAQLIPGGVAVDPSRVYWTNDPNDPAGNGPGPTILAAPK